MTTARRFRIPFWLISVVVIGLLVLIAVPYVVGYGQSVGYEPQGPPRFSPEREARVEVEVTPDTRPAFQFDPSQPWQIDLGRGSGMYGLDTVALASDGRAVLYLAKWIRNSNVNSQTWQKATLTLPPDAVRRIAD